MRKNLVLSQLTNQKTKWAVLDDMIELAENVYQFKNVPSYIDVGYVNQVLLFNGSIAWFYDEILDSVIALPYDVMNGYDIYGRPNAIMARAKNGRYHKKLEKGEFIIMYDNTRRVSMMPKIMQRADRISLSIRTEDINIVQQRTPRIWRTSRDQEVTVRDLLNQVDGMVENVVAYDNIDLDDLTSVVAPAPYIVDKLDLHLEKEWASFYRLIGITSIVEEKKERLITDEVSMGQGGTVASRYNRFEPRQRAVDEINKKWGLNIEIEYYDGVPTSIKEKEVDNNVLSISEDVYTN
ncbi:MAG: hypothetical protein J6T10_21525 [Methanobrevibacter sp.]|nr:hypothetical protein [Methanobrevibacter sp.]